MLKQVYMEICVKETEAEDGLTTHKEIKPTNFLSNLACTIPLPDFNQSPRNMYQCQMAKQTMATPIITWHLNSENKLYRLQTPTAPFFRPAHYDYIGTYFLHNFCSFSYLYFCIHLIVKGTSLLRFFLRDAT